VVRPCLALADKGSVEEMRTRPNHKARSESLNSPDDGAYGGSFDSILVRASLRDKLLFTLTVVCAFAHASFGQIGETKEELSSRYGPPSYVAPLAGSRPSVYDLYSFRHNNLTIAVCFKAGRAASCQYRKTEKSILGLAQIRAVLGGGF
jgi:hypothetical protein